MFSPPKGLVRNPTLVGRLSPYGSTSLASSLEKGAKNVKPFFRQFVEARIS